MGLINVIPAVSIYAVAVPGAPGKPAEVRLYDGNGDRFVATVIPFPGFEGSVNVAMGDVDGDGVLDLIVGAGKDHAPEVVAYTGAARAGRGAFVTEIARFQAFAAGARAASAWPLRRSTGRPFDNIIVASGPGIPSEVKVYRSALPSAAGAAPPLFSTFKPYGDDRVRREHRHRLRRFLDRPREHRHRARCGQPGRGQGVRLPAAEAHRPGCAGGDGGNRATGEHRLVPSVRQRLSRRRFAGDGLARGLARRRQANRRQPARRQRCGQDLLERLGIGRRAVAVPAKPHAPRSRRPIPRDRRLQALRRVCRHARCHHQHDEGRAPARQRRRSGGADGSVVKYDLVRPNAQATTLQAVRLGQVWTGKASQPAFLGGD